MKPLSSKQLVLEGVFIFRHIKLHVYETGHSSQRLFKNIVEKQ